MFKIIQVLIFLVLITLPVLGHHFGFGTQINLIENRHLTDKPIFISFKDMHTYSDLFSKYFNDHFGFRNLLVKTDRTIQLNWFGTAPDSSGVTIGRDHWLFYTPTEVFLDTINARPFSENDLSKIKSNLENIQNYFQRQNIKFYLLVAPNAQSIYSEELPFYMKKVQPDSRLDQITNYLTKAHSLVNFINPTEVLLEAKKQNQLYYKVDTHWNEYGAFIAYQTLLKSIAKDYPNISLKSLNDFKISYQPSSRHDLGILIGDENYFNEAEPIFISKTPLRAVLLTKECQNPYEKCGEVIKSTNNLTFPKMIMFRDSFSTSMIPFLSEHFQLSRYLWEVTPFSTDVINQDHPDIVIYELTERELWRLPAQTFDFQK